MRKPTQKDRVKAHLLEHGSLTNVEAMHMQIFRLSERVRELQTEGLEITGDFVRVDGKKTGTYQYVLTEKPPEPKKQHVEIVMRDGKPVAVFI